MTKRESIINALCDLMGYSPDDFDDKSMTEIIEDLSEKESEQLYQYMK